MSSLVSLPILFRLMDEDELGLWQLLGNSQMFLGLLGFGVGPILTRHIALAKGRSGALCSGDPRTATEHCTRAIRLSPLDPSISQNFARLGVSHMMTGDYEEAVKFGRQAIRELPRNVVAHRVVAASLALLGRADEAAGAMRALLAVAPNFTMSQMRRFVPYRF